MANQDQHHVQNFTDNGTIAKETRCTKSPYLIATLLSHPRVRRLRFMGRRLMKKSPCVRCLRFIGRPFIMRKRVLAASCPSPSFYRTIHDEKKGDYPPPSFYRTIHDEKQGITEDEEFVMPRGNYFIVKPMVSTDNNVPLEDDWETPEELAVCNSCFKKFVVEEIMLRTKCGCKDALVHEACALNNKCASCGKNVDKIKVTLLMKPNSVEIGKEKRVNKWKMFCLI